MLKILIVDDEHANRVALQEVLARLGHQTELAIDGQDALAKASSLSFNLILSDLRMPKMDGLQLFDSLNHGGHLQGRGVSFAFMTAYGQIEDAVAAMRKGAIHFLSKPLRKKDLVNLLDEVCAIRKNFIGRGSALASVGSTEPGKRTAASEVEYPVIYRSRLFGDVVDLIDRVAATTASVLLYGESGTGKEVLARRLHGRSPRQNHPFVAVNVAALPENLLESELFGHERGAFTGAESARLGQIRAADHGTFFMDEIASMPLSVQVKLLRVLQERKVQPLGALAPIDVNVRWVSAANRDLDAEASFGRFREDLLYRLKVVVIEVPPLRARPEDIDPLVDHFRQDLAAQTGRELIVPESVRALMRAYPWPGNVRELRNVVERALVLSRDGVFTTDLLPAHWNEVSAHRPQEVRIALGSSLQTVEDRLIEETLKFCGGDKAEAATILGINPRTIYRWLDRRQLEVEGLPAAPSEGSEFA